MSTLATRRALRSADALIGPDGDGGQAADAQRNFVHVDRPRRQRHERDPFPIERIAVGNVFVPNGRRPVTEDNVLRLADSIHAMGLRTPISVRYVDEINIPGEGEVCNVAVLVAGAHRLEACKRLGMTEIDCLVIAGDETDARLWEIAENLHRAELTVAERAEHISEWMRITGEKQSAQLGPKGPIGHRPEGGINAAVRDLGITRQEGQRAAKIAKLSPETKEAAREAGIDDNQSALLRVAREKDTVDQLAAIKREREAAEKRARQPEPDEAREDRLYDLAFTIATRCEFHLAPIIAALSNRGDRAVLLGWFQKFLERPDAGAAT